MWPFTRTPKPDPRAAYDERYLAEMGRIQNRLARIEALLLRIDRWAGERIDGWPHEGG